MIGALEENVLTLLCWDATHAPALAMQLDAKLFSTRNYQAIATAAIEHVQKYGKPPQSHIRDLLEKKLKNGKDGELLWLAVDAMEELQRTIQPDFVLTQLHQFIEIRQMSQALEDAADALQSGDIDKAHEALHQQQRAQPLSRGIYLSETDRSLAFLDHVASDEFTMGIEALDARGIRPERGTMTVLLAPAKRGKTQFLTNCGAQNMARGRKILHITLENGEEKMCGRYVQTIFGMTKGQAKTVRVPMFKRSNGGSSASIDFDTFTPDTIDTDSRSDLVDKMRRLKRRAPLLIKEFPMNSLTMAQLSNYLEWLDRSENFRPDMMILDYPGIMAIDPKNVRIELGRIFVGLKGLGQRRNMAVVVVAQGNRVSSTAKTVKANHVGEDYSIIGSADTILTYSQTPDERSIGLARILVAGARHDEDQYVVLVSQSYATAQFCLDSVYLEKHFEDEVRRLTGEGEDDDAD